MEQSPFGPDSTLRSLVIRALFLCEADPSYTQIRTVLRGMDMKWVREELKIYAVETMASNRWRYSVWMGLATLPGRYHLAVCMSIPTNEYWLSDGITKREADLPGLVLTKYLSKGLGLVVIVTDKERFEQCGHIDTNHLRKISTVTSLAGRLLINQNGNHPMGLADISDTRFDLIVEGVLQHHPATVTWAPHKVLPDLSGVAIAMGTGAVPVLWA